jgi:cyclophilin family peptidyl-prolyl cis-trans isomerase/protein-disulfide isomerase
MVWTKWKVTIPTRPCLPICTVESRLIIRNQIKLRLCAALAVALPTALSACTPADHQIMPTSFASPTSVEAAQLGPTSTSKAPTVTAIPAQPTPTIRPLDPVTNDDWIRGPLGAQFSFLVYCDFQSPPCAEFNNNFQSLRELRPGETQLIYRQFPLLVLNDKAGLAAELALAADAQGAFWPMHDLLYEQQRIWTSFTAEEFIIWAQDAADSLGISGDLIAADLREGKYSQAVEDAFVQGVNSGLPGTPFILMNGEWFRASPTPANLEAAIRLELLTSMQYKEPPELQLKSDSLYIARIKLTTGDLVIQLLPESAPAMVANFIFLAREGWFNDTIFHRVVPGSYVEGGDPSGTGFGGPGYFLIDEIDPTLSFDRAGRLVMANSGPDTNGSRFAITLRDMPEWEGTKTIFGQVLEGLLLLADLEAREPLDDLLEKPEVSILDVTIEEQ